MDMEAARIQRRPDLEDPGDSLAEEIARMEIVDQVRDGALAARYRRLAPEGRWFRCSESRTTLQPLSQRIMRPIGVVYDNLRNETFSAVHGFAIPSFVLQQILSTAGAMLIGVLIVIFLALLSAALTRNTSGGSFIDHITEQRASVLLNQPYYIAPVLCALVLGMLGRRSSRSRWAAWVWILPTAILVWNLLTWKGVGPPITAVYWRDVWANYFGSDCGGSECLYEVFVTIPFYTSVAYTFGWLFSGFLQRRKMAASHPTLAR